ncbi:MAG: DUF4170 domain-containing protein [Rhodospirillaceae bacterium]
MQKRTYWVVGGEYADTSFKTLANGAAEERFGPFTEDGAKECWRALTGKTVDNAMVRYFVQDEGGGEEQFYVVGGEYSDTDFKTIAQGRKLENYGPFSEQEARMFWRGITSQTVDSALHRYSILSAEDVEDNPTA